MNLSRHPLAIVKGRVVHAPIRLLHLVQRRILPRALHSLYSSMDYFAAPRVDAGHTPRVRVYGIYRDKNVDYVVNLIAEGDSSVSHHWHRLESEASDVLSDVPTLASGPGARIPLLGDLMRRRPPEAGEWVALCDDDIEFVRGSISELVRLAALAGFDVSQPAHVPLSSHSFGVNRQKPLSVARRTAFVEVGPLVIFSPDAQRELFPLAEDAEMGWGLDVDWSTRQGLRLGVIDQTLIRHFGTIASGYQRTREDARLHAALKRAELESVFDLDHDIGRPWRPWQASPPWIHMG